MAQEIERKFLVESDFRPFVLYSNTIRQGYLCFDAERTVRVRICDDQAFITVKSAPNERGWSRYEFEMPIPLEEAETMLTMCLPGVIDKTRHYIDYRGYTWEVDVFHGDNAGLIVAEIELESEEEMFELPPWTVREVTGDPRFSNAMLAQHPFCRWDTGAQMECL